MEVDNEHFPLKRTMEENQTPSKLTKFHQDLQICDEDYQMSKGQFIQKFSGKFDDHFQMDQFYETHIAFEQIAEPRSVVKLLVETPFGAAKNISFCPHCNIRFAKSVLELLPGDPENDACYVCPVCKKIGSATGLPSPKYCSWCSKWIPENYLAVNSSMAPKTCIQLPNVHIACDDRCLAKLSTWYEKHGLKPQWIDIPSM